MQSLSLGNSSAKFSSLGLISCPNSSPTLPDASWMSHQPSNKTHPNQISSFPHLNPISYPQTYEKVEISPVTFLPDTRFLKLQGRQYTQSVCRTEIRKRPGENSINAHSEMYLDKILHEEPESRPLQVCIPNSITTATSPIHTKYVLNEWTNAPSIMCACQQVCADEAKQYTKGYGDREIQEIYYWVWNEYLLMACYQINEAMRNLQGHLVQ